jgi:hypothetical protein
MINNPSLYLKEKAHKRQTGPFLLNIKPKERKWNMSSQIKKLF